MKVSEIVVGGTYTNGKGTERKVLAEGAEFKYYPSQEAGDCIQYTVTKRGPRVPHDDVGRKMNSTRASFATWAKARVDAGGAA